MGQLNWIWFWHCIGCWSSLKHIKSRALKLTTFRLTAYSVYSSTPERDMGQGSQVPEPSVCALSCAGHPCPALPYPTQTTVSHTVKLCSGQPSLQPPVTPALVLCDSVWEPSWCPVSLLPSPSPTLRGLVSGLFAQAVCPALAGSSSCHIGGFPMRLAGSSGHTHNPGPKSRCSAPGAWRTDPPVATPRVLCRGHWDPQSLALHRPLQVSR